MCLSENTRPAEPKSERLAVQSWPPPLNFWANQLDYARWIPKWVISELALGPGQQSIADLGH